MRIRLPTTSSLVRLVKHRWQDWINLMFSVWLYFSPWLLEYSIARAGVWDSVIFGIAIFSVSLWALITPQAWQRWANLVLGATLSASPWILGFSSYARATWNLIFVGVVVAVLSVGALGRRPLPLSGPRQNGP